MQAALMGKGFRPREGDHRYMHLYVEGKKTSVRTKFSHAAEVYGDNLLAQLRRQLRLNRTQFDELMECPMGEAEYAEALRQQGVI